MSNYNVSISHTSLNIESNMSHPLSRPRIRAFTLVELLVVLSILAVLIAMLMPAIGQAREVSKRIVCASNLRQIGVAFGSYLADTKGAYPTSGYANGTPHWSWDAALHRYLGGRLTTTQLSDAYGVSTTVVPGTKHPLQVMACPSDVVVRTPIGGMPANNYWARTYVINGGTGFGVTGGGTFSKTGPGHYSSWWQAANWEFRRNIRETDMPQAAQMLLLVEKASPGHGNLGNNTASFINDGSPWVTPIHSPKANFVPKGGTTFPAGFVNGESNYLFCDGRVEGHKSLDSTGFTTDTDWGLGGVNYSHWGHLVGKGFWTLTAND